MDIRFSVSRFCSRNVALLFGVLAGFLFASSAEALERQSLNVTVISRTGIPDRLDIASLLAQIEEAADIELRVSYRNVVGVDFDNTDVFVLVSDQFGSDYGIYFGGLMDIFGDRDSPFRARFMAEYASGCHYTDTAYEEPARSPRQFLVVLEPMKLSRNTTVFNPFAECLVSQLLKVMSYGQWLEDVEGLSASGATTTLTPIGIASFRNAADAWSGGAGDASVPRD